MDTSVQTQATILDALPAHIALLDPHGYILVVNEGWRHFGAANGLQCADFCVGDNYLEVCEGAELQSSEAQGVVNGIGQVLRGELSSFTLEYPCHSPTEKRWFRLQVTPLCRESPTGAVVMHLNITEQKASAANALNHSNYAQPGNLTLGTSGFASVTNLQTAEGAGPRSIQLTARVTF